VSSTNSHLRSLLISPVDSLPTLDHCHLTCVAHVFSSLPAPYLIVMEAFFSKVTLAVLTPPAMPNVFERFGGPPPAAPSAAYPQGVGQERIGINGLALAAPPLRPYRPTSRAFLRRGEPMARGQPAGHAPEDALRFNPVGSVAMHQMPRDVPSRDSTPPMYLVLPQPAAAATGPRATAGTPAPPQMLGASSPGLSQSRLSSSDGSPRPYYASMREAAANHTNNEPALSHDVSAPGLADRAASAHDMDVGGLPQSALPLPPSRGAISTRPAACRRRPRASAVGGSPCGSPSTRPRREPVDTSVLCGGMHDQRGALGGGLAQVTQLHASLTSGLSSVRRELTSNRKELAVTNNNFRMVVKKVDDIAVLVDQLALSMVVQRRALIKLGVDMASGFAKFGETAAAAASTEPLSGAGPGARPRNEEEMERQDAMWVLESKVTTPACAGMCESQVSK